MRTELSARGIDAHGFIDLRAVEDDFGDPWTAAVVAFHEHAWEAPVLARILTRPYFYVGVMGSRKAHETRLAQLREMGVRDRGYRAAEEPHRHDRRRQEPGHARGGHPCRRSGGGKGGGSGGVSGDVRGLNASSGTAARGLRGRVANAPLTGCSQVNFSL